MKYCVQKGFGQKVLISIKDNGNGISQKILDKIFQPSYVEASIWCLLTTNNYQSAVLKAVNLGEDTDTTGAVTGGLAGLLNGFRSIPVDWVGKLARRNDIEDLAIRLGISIRG